MDTQKEYRNQVISNYLHKLNPLFNYIPYLKEKEGAKVRSFYSGENNSLQSIPVPVFDSNVLAFVKEAQKTGLMDRNYVYAYRKIGLQDPDNERFFISGAKFEDIEAIVAIITRYVLSGMSRSVLWADAVEEGVWLHALLKLKELLEVHEQPLA